MALIQCIECKREVSPTAKICPGCGARPAPKSSSFGVVVLVVIGLIVAFVGFAMIRDADPAVREMRNDRAAYELCMKKMKKALGNPIVAGACEQLRTKFRAKYNREP